MVLGGVVAPECAQRDKHMFGEATFVFKLGLFRAECKEVDCLNVTYVHLNVCFLSKSVDKLEI